MRSLAILYFVIPPLLLAAGFQPQRIGPFALGAVACAAWLLTPVFWSCLTFVLVRPGQPLAPAPETAPDARSLYRCLLGACQKAGWKHRPQPDTQSLEFEFASEHGIIEGHARVHEKFGQLLIYSRPRLLLPETLRPAMAEFLTQVNYALPIGNFELDLRQGMVRFKTSLTLGEDGLLPPASMVTELLELNLATMSLYLPGILAVAAGQEPARALSLIEEPPEPAAEFSSRKVYLN